MNKLFWKRAGITAVSVIGGAYAVFLVSPLILNPIIDSYIPQIKNIIHETSGLNSELTNVKVVTTPKLTAGLKVGKFSLLEPDNTQFFSADDFQVKMSLLPILAGKIRVDAVQLKNANANIQINNDGHFAVEKYLPATPDTDSVNSLPENRENVSSLPFGLKLSNHLPDIKIDGYDIIITDGTDKYTLSGNKTEITDFIVNKSIKVKASGKAVLKDREQFHYNIKVLNKIMPDVELNDIVFTPQAQEETAQEFEMPDIIGILKGIYANNLTADADVNLLIERNNIKGNANFTNLSVINLPSSIVKLKFKGESIDIISDIYTAKNEVSKINGLIKTGKNPNIDLNIKSKVEISNILRIVKDVALIFDIRDLQTLSANGKLDADFSIKSNLKTVKSSGYLKIPSADVYYGLYKIGIDDINADVRLDNNNININNIGFTILDQPLKLFGTITGDAVSDLHLSAENLSLKGLLVAAGQASLMKENQVNSGLVSLKVDIQGKLDKINPAVKLNLDNINIKNIPSNTSLSAPSTIVGISGTSLTGKAESKNLKIINPCAKVSIPSLIANISEKEIFIPSTPAAIEKINLNVSGKITNYLTEKIGLDFVTTGDIKSKLTGDMNIAKQTLNLNYATTESSTIIIPMFDKSKMTFSGNIFITDSMMNPVIKGDVNIPELTIPEIPVTMENLDIKLNGHILNGTASAAKFTSGGIKAENLTSDFSMKGDKFYLNKLKGDAFDGKINGNIVYNLSNAQTGIIFSGEGLNAEKAVYGCVGIKNAIYGTLGFDTTMSLKVVDYNEMMKSLKGNLNFNVKNGSFGAIGKLDTLLQANNIITNSILKTTTSTLVNNLVLADTAKFEYLDGHLSFENGWANLNPIKSSGNSLAYYITGKYNLINGTTNINILGRLDAPIVAKLGPIGQLSADKLLSYIPKFGEATAKIANALTTNPKGENIAAIPALTNGSTNYKDFKVVFNGGLESTSSVKSFKWLTTIDTSAIETKTVKETIKDITTSVTEDYKSTVESVKDAVTSTKEDWNETREQLKNSAEELKNLFKKKEN